jgi:hypothetical protein
MLNGLQNRARELAKFGQPFAEPAPQQARDFLGAPVFGIQPHFGLGRKIDDWQFALHNDLRMEWAMKWNAATGRLFDRDDELPGVDGFWGLRRRPRDEPDGYSDERRRDKGGNRDRFAPRHLVRPPTDT